MVQGRLFIQTRVHIIYSVYRRFSFFRFFNSYYCLFYSAKIRCESDDVWVFDSDVFGLIKIASQHILQTLQCQILLKEEDKFKGSRHLLGCVENEIFFFITINMKYSKNIDNKN